MQRPEGRGRVAKGREVRARGRILLPEDLRTIQRFVNRRRHLSLREIAVELSKLWQWRRPNGELRERACSNLLLRLARRGDLCLPRELQKHLRTRKPPQASPIPHCEPTEPVWPCGEEGSQSETGGLVLRLISETEQGAWDRFLEHYHYLGRAPRVGECLRYVAFLGGKLVGLLGWGSAALKCGPRDRYLGWDAARRIENLQFVANNVRFLVLGESRQRNLASQILAASLSRLSSDWEQLYSHPIYLAETFVDPGRFRGSCYRASNWLLLGETRGWSKHGRRYRHHGQNKLVFVYPLHRRAKELLAGGWAGAGEEKKEEKDSMAVALDVNALPLSGNGGLFEVMGQIPDPRKPKGRRHPLISILAMAACATLTGARGFEAIAQWAAGVSAEVRQRLGCRRKRAPSEPTFRRTLRNIGVKCFEELVGQWFRRQADLKGKGVAIDGKALCGSRDGDQPPAHLVSLHTHEEGVVLGQERVLEKTNEIKAVKPLLEPVDVEGAVITADAMHAQKETAKYIVEKKKADYLFVVKENQPTLLEDIQTLRLGDFSPSSRDDEQGSRPPGGAPSLDESGTERVP